MALSIEEQRILAKIESELARSEPALAAYLSAFGRTGMLRSPQPRLHSPRVLVVASLAALVLLTIIPVVVYTLVSLHVSLHPGSRGQPTGHSAVSGRHHSVLPHPIMSVPR